MENSPDKGNTNAFSSCCSSHTGSRMIYDSSQYANFTKLSHISADIDFWTYVDWDFFFL
jgi:hypothetical protein